MATHKKAALEMAAKLFGKRSLEDVVKSLRRRSPIHDPLPPRVARLSFSSPEAVAERHKQLEEQGIPLGHLCPRGPIEDTSYLMGNIEGYIGDVVVPVGLIGPLRINGTNANGDFFVPMATTEGALVASYQRGATIISKCGGATAMCLTERVLRAPVFVFNGMVEAAQFIFWVISNFESLQEAANGTSRYTRLLEMRSTLQGNMAYLIFEYSTGDAAGQNMVTFATRAVCEKILAECPVRSSAWYLESNMSGDKKATVASFMYVRGKKVVAEAVLQAKKVKRYLHTTCDEMLRCWQISFQGGVLTGSIGVQGHFANGLAAIFLACGQDVACVAEAAVGTTQMTVTEEGDLYVAVQLPNIIVGTVGGGTRLPTQRAGLEIMDCYGPGRARKFAEIVATVVLAGEISLMAAIASGDFDGAHRKYGRAQ